MAKQTHPEPAPNSSRNSLIILALGAVLVAALVVWALTRTVEQPVATSAERFPTTEMPPAATASIPAADTAATAAPTTAPATATNQVTAIPGDRSTVKRIAAEDLREKLNRGEVTVIDTRAASAFANGHIPGALNIPMSSVEANLDRIPRNKEIVTYCT